MHVIHSNDELYGKAGQLASARGMATVEELVKRVIKEAIEAETENFDHLFTPEVLAQIRAADQEAMAGKGLSIDEVRQHFEDKARVRKQRQE